MNVVRLLVAVLFLLPSLAMAQTGVVSGASVTATGSTASRTLADRFSQIINVKDYGAFGDTESVISSTVSISSSSKNLNVSGSPFASSDVGKTIVIDGAGVVPTTGGITSIPVTSAGSSYTSTPTISFSGTGSGVGAVAAVNMALVSGSVATGGAGCTNGSQTFTVSGGTLGTSAQVTGTVSSNVLSGSLTVAQAGSYLPGTSTSTMLSGATVTLTGGGCATAPTMTPSWGVGTVSMTGIGRAYPTSGVTASLSGGSATVGTPVISPVTQPLQTTIASFTDASDVVLTDAASTTLSSSVQTVTWGHDDTAAFTAADNAAAALGTSGLRKAIYVPAGNYLLSAALPTFFHNGIAIAGDGQFKTNIRVAPSLSGPVFSWSECWLGGGAYPQSGLTSDVTTSYAGPAVSGITITGDLSSANEQDAFVFYDRNDNVRLDNISVYYLSGRGIQVGAQVLNSSQAYMREGLFSHLSFGHVGGPAWPDIEFNTVGTGDSTNTFTGTDINMWDILGPGVVIRNQNTVKAVSLLKWFGLRIEGGQTGYTGDALQIGDSTQTGAVSNSDFHGLQIISPGGNGISVLAQSSTYAPFQNRFEANIQSVAGSGLNIQYGRNLQFLLSGMQSNSYNVVLASTAGANIVLDTGGSEGTMTYNNTSTASLLTPLRGIGAPNTNGIVGTIHDGSAAGGSAIGALAVDLNLNKTAANNVAAGPGSVLIGGNSNTINVGANNSAIVGGATNTASGQYASFSGRGVQDNGAYGWRCYSNFTITGAGGDSQTCDTTLHATVSNTTVTRLTSDNLAANGTNCVNMTAASAYLVDIKLSAFDATTPTSSYAWIATGLLGRGSTAASTFWTVDPTVSPRTIPASPPTGSSISVSADTTNSCLNLSFTPPTGNTDTWRITATAKFTRTR